MTTPVKWGPAFLANTVTGGNQDQNCVVGLPDGRFMVVWEDAGQLSGDLSQFAVHARVFDGDGMPVGVEFRVNTTAAGNQSTAAVAALADGRVVVTGDDGSLARADTDGMAVFGQIFDPRVAAVALTGWRATMAMTRWPAATSLTAWTAARIRWMAASGPMCCGAAAGRICCLAGRRAMFSSLPRRQRRGPGLAGTGSPIFRRG